MFNLFFFNSFFANLSIQNNLLRWGLKLPMLYKNIEKHVQEQLDEDISYSKIVAFASDGWTARNNDPYESLTVNYCNKDFELKKLTLSCQNFIGRKTGIKLAQGLDNMINKFPILAGENLKKVCDRWC